MSVFSQAGARRIGVITIERHNVFDRMAGGVDSLVGTVANAIHVQTREQVIRNELLFAEGGSFDTALIEESERNLRALPFLGDIAIRSDTVNDSTINVTVETHDKWTLTASPSYQQGGGIRNISVTTKDDNFLGNGQSLSLGYNYRSDLDDPHAFDLIFSERHLFGTRWGSAVQFKSSHDLNVQTVLLDRAFYADEASWATSFYFDAGHLIKPTYENGIRIREDEVHQQNFNTFYARSFGNETKVRPAAAFVEVRTSGSAVRSNENLILFNASVNLMNRHYSKESYLDHHGRTEDVPLGFVGNVLLGRNVYFPAGNEPGTLIQFNWQQAIALTRSLYVSYGVAASSLFGHSSPGESVLQWSLLGHTELGERNLIVARVVGIEGANWSAGRQIFLGSSTGLRGYNNFDLEGQRSLVYNLEDRVYLPGELWIFRPGLTLFLDGGSIWNEGEAPRDHQFRTSAGFGLRIENTKQQGAGVIRIDVAFNCNERKFGEIIISSSLLFSAFSDIGFISPITTGIF